MFSVSFSRMFCSLHWQEDLKYHTCLATSRRHATPCSKLGNTTDPYFWYSGTGRIFIVTSVITPRVPVDRKGVGVKEKRKQKTMPLQTVYMPWACWNILQGSGTYPEVKWLTFDSHFPAVQVPYNMARQLRFISVIARGNKTRHYERNRGQQQQLKHRYKETPGWHGDPESCQPQAPKRLRESMLASFKAHSKLKQHNDVALMQILDQSSKQNMWAANVYPWKHSNKWKQAETKSNHRENVYGCYRKHFTLLALCICYITSRWMSALLGHFLWRKLFFFFFRFLAERAMWLICWGFTFHTCTTGQNCFKHYAEDENINAHRWTG